MELGLKGRAAVITGGSRGVGKAIARELAAEGVNLVLLARGKEVLEKTAEEIAKESGVQVPAVPADIANTASLQAAAAAAKDRFGAIHIAINNAGGPMRRMDRQITWPDTDWVDDVNRKMERMLRTTQAFLPLMPRDGTGRIAVNAVVPGLAGTEGREAWAENMLKQHGKTKAEFPADFCRRMGIIAGHRASMEDVAGASRLVIDGGMSANPRPA